MIDDGPQSISVDDLLIGDIVFFTNYSKQAHHVAVYAGKKSGTHFIVHAVSHPYNSVMTTRLKADDFPYRVFRCKDFNLAMQVTCRMQSWVRCGLSFSQDKSESLYANFTDSFPNCHPKEGGQHQLEHAKKDFNVIFYRYIAMASHPKRPFMVNASQNEGVRCSEAIVMAYNIETLLCSGAVYSSEKLKSYWVSDKTAMPPEAIQSKYNPDKNYWTYFERCNNPDEYQPFGQIPENGIKDGHFPCSLSAWNYSKYPSIEKFIEHYPFSLPFDSKISSSWAMMTYMQQTPELWQDLGELTVLKSYYPLEGLEAQKHKEEWKEYVVQLFQRRKRFDTTFSQNLTQSMGAFPDFRTSPSKEFQDPATKRPRSLSCNLGALLEHQSTPMDDGATPIFDAAQTVIFQRAQKYTSPSKKTNSVSVSSRARADSARKILF